jgi:serine protease Do
MIKYFFKILTVVAITGFFYNGAMAQQENDKLFKTNSNDEIIIRKKGDKDAKVTVEIKDGEVKVNGKPLSEFKDDNVDISKRRAGAMVRAYTTPRSPFRGSVQSFDQLDSIYRNDISSMNMRLNMTTNSNKALLGVTTEKSDNGVRINSVTKGSAAEKAGLKENDVITKVDETVVNSPEDLTKAIGKFKPEDKTVISYKRDNKEQKATVSLGKRGEATTLYGGDYNDSYKNLFLDKIRPEIELYGLARGANPRLGIKAQDTEEGKGVKVLNVDDASTAQKAGIKEGDIITEFDGKAVNSATELADAAREARDKNSMKIILNRNGKSQELEIKIPKKLKTANL